jgi:fucose 4-O-acetylase-like acetyltransferase
MKKRLIYIDRLKGFAIYLVVLGHIYQNMVVQGTETILFSLIYAFHMPLFFFLSGYISEKTNKMIHYKDGVGYLLKKA